MSATIKRYEIHNKLLNLWVKLFPDVACDQVDKVGVNSYELNDSVLYCTLTYHDGRINATKGTRITNAPGLLGTARVLAGRNKGIGFHMWESNGQEFEEFVVVEKPR